MDNSRFKILEKALPSSMRVKLDRICRYLSQNMASAMIGAGFSDRGTGSSSRLERNEKGDEIVLVRHSWAVIMTVEDVRMAMLKLLSDRKYRIESNPTSNLMIGPFNQYRELPIMRFCKNNVNVSVNTDAKGVFSTSLYIEYSLLALALQKSGMGWNTIELGIKQLLANSSSQRFGEVRLNIPIG